MRKAAEGLSQVRSGLVTMHSPPGDGRQPRVYREQLQSGSFLLPVREMRFPNTFSCEAAEPVPS